MSNRLLEANQQQVASAPDPLERTRLLQDRAILQARLGRVEEALRTLTDAEQQAPAGLPAPLKLRFVYARAIAAYFGKHFSEAVDRMQSVLDQAHGLDDGLATECQSTLALFLQREGNVRAAARHARAVLAHPNSSLESRYRASLSLASLHQDARDYQEAVRLYRETQEVVRSLGDDIAMASWMGRSAASQAAHARQAAAAGELNAARTVQDAVDALERSIAFSEQLPDAPDVALSRLLLAEMRVLQKRYREALALYDAQLPAIEGDGFLHEVTAAIADRALCLLKLGQADAGYTQAALALRRVDQSTPADIRAIVHENMAVALQQSGQAVEAEQHRVLSRMAWETYAHEQREARRLLRENAAETLH